MAAEIDPEARDRLLAALAGGASVSAAARAAGYSRKHVYRLLEDPRFAAAVEAKRAERPAAAPSADEELALEVLRSIARDKRALAIARVGAAKALLARSSAGRTSTTRELPSSRPPAPILKLDAETNERAAAAWLEKQASKDAKPTSRRSAGGIAPDRGPSE